MTIHDTSVHVLSAVASIGALGKENKQLASENEQLINATAKQAATIRTLNERNSNLGAEVNLEKYNVEFLKVQGRKTRLKLRALKQLVGQLRNHLGQVLDRAERAEKANTILRNQIASMVASQTELMKRNDQLEASLYRMVDGTPLPFQIVTETAPFSVVRHTSGRGHSMMDQVVVKQLGMSLRVAPEHRRDLLAHAEVAKEAAKMVSRKMELAILEALRGEEVTHDQINEARRKDYEERTSRFMDPDTYRHPLF